MQPKAQIQIIIFFLLTIILSIWQIVIPFFQAPDEERHFSTIIWYAQTETSEQVLTKTKPHADYLISSTYNIPEDLSEILKLTDFENNRFKPLNHQEFSDNSFWGPGEEEYGTQDYGRYFTTTPPTIVNYPPLYYWVGSLFYRAVQYRTLFTRIFAMQVYSILWSMITLGFTYLIARRMNYSKALAALFTALVGLQPMYSFMSGVINVDIALIALITGFIYFLIRIIQNFKPWRAIIGCIITAILAGLTKPPGYILWIPFFMALLVQVWRILPARKWLKFSISAIFCAIVGYIFTLERIQDLIKDVGFSINTFTSTANFPSIWDALREYATNHFTFTQQYAIFASYWGNFGWLDTPLSFWTYALIALFVLVGILLFGWYLVAKKESIKNEKATYWLLIILALIFHLGILLAEFKGFKDSGTAFGLQGRYFLPTISILMLCLFKGYTGLFSPRNQYFIAIAFALAMLLFNLFCIVKAMIPAYYL